MSGRTTIEITNELKERLREERLERESNYSQTIARLLGDYDESMANHPVLDNIHSETIINVEDARMLGDAVEKSVVPVIQDGVTLDASERQKIAEEVEARLR